MWAIQGAKRWYDTRKLLRPAEVEAATKEYRGEQDEFGQYMEDHFVKDDPFGDELPTKILRTSEVLDDYSTSGPRTTRLNDSQPKTFGKASERATATLHTRGDSGIISRAFGWKYAEAEQQYWNHED